MNHNHLQIPIESDDSSWRQRCNRRMEELKNTQFSSLDAAASSQPVRQLLHKELVGKVMAHELYNAVEDGNVDNFVGVLNQQCRKRKLSLSDIFYQVTGAGDSLLHVAAHHKKEHIAELIAHHFPELLIRRNIRGDTPLHVAVRSKNSNIVHLILSQYAIEKSNHDEMNDKELTRETNEHGDTPLHEAIYSGDVDVIKEIFFANNDVVHYLNKSRQSPLYLAVVNGNVEILNLLLEISFPVDLPKCLGNSPLHAALLERKSDLINGILAKRPELVYLRDEDGGTPLHYAAYIGYVEGFHILLENSIDSSYQTALEGNNKGDLPIHLACKKGHVRVINDFLQHEWPINFLLNQKCQNILHVAAKNGKSKVVQYLLKNSKIDQFTINQRDNDGNTAFHLASINLFPKVLYFITQDKRTDVNRSNNDGFTARDIVHLALKKQMTIRKFLANLVLKEAGALLKVNDMLSSQCQQSPRMQLSLKDLINTFLVVATLMVTVTFAAGFTVPGGVYSSDAKDPKNIGMAILADKPFFWVFTTFNMIAMYSSVIACGLMLMALIFDHKLATGATILAMCCLVLAFSTVPIAFMGAVYLVVGNNYALSRTIIVIGVVYTSLILLGLFFGFFPIGIRLLLFRHVGRLVLRILIALTKYEDRPEYSLPRKENKDLDD